MMSSSAPRNESVVGENPILVCDDDPNIRALFSRALENAGFSTLQAVNGLDAAEKIQERSFAAVLLDNHMPGLDGISLISKLRSDDATATLPIILVTGASEVAERIRGLQAGASDYLTKPVEIDELVARVRSQLRGQAAWMHRVEGHLRERAAIARALAQIRPADTPEATASIICFELSLLHQLSSVAMFSFGQGDLVMPLGRYGRPVLGEVVGEALDPLASRYLIEKAALGPWTERSESLRLTVGMDGIKAASTLAFAPMVYESQLLGILALAAEPSDPASPASFVAHALSAAIDFAGVTAGLLAPALTERGKDEAKSSLLDNVIRNHEFFPVYQPIVDIASKKIVGYETLTRFHDGMRPDLRFMEAAVVGRGVDLEIVTMTDALREAQKLPADAFLSMNVSPTLVMEPGALQAVLRNAGDREIVLELTEHERVDDYGQLRSALDQIEPRIKLSVDDAGSGFASLRHVLSLQPHFVKLDASLVHDIHTDPARQALVAGIEYFATETDCRLIAEGIEQDDELEVLSRLDVELGQGYLLGRPSAVTTA
jgi:EAL domain-containing protein (putative c-di-GMP-specific phosphodiesterase class I)/DNA-binding response OmpR family regulator